MSPPLWTLSAHAAAQAIANDKLTSEDLVTALLERVEDRDATVHGWATPVDREEVIAQAKACDASAPKGPLHGVPVAIKDVIDVEGQPTRYGTEFWSHAPVLQDSDCAARLRAAGAVLMGKAVTAEFATYHPGPTTNPHNPAHTPGGSSSGSAALVADGQVPLSLGTQTAGSVIRPASFNGIMGFKPSFGRYPDDGVLETAPSLDTVGVFGRCLEDIILIDSVLADEPAAQPNRAKPRIGLCKSPAWLQADAQMRSTFNDFSGVLNANDFQAVPVTLPPCFDDLLRVQALIHRYEAAKALGHIRHTHSDDVSEKFKAFIDAGAVETQADYDAAIACQQICKDELPAVFDKVDLLLVPGAPGAAPKGLDATGDPIFQRIWTAVGAPSLGFPAAWNTAGLPLGLQLIGSPGQDAACLSYAAHILPYAKLK